MNNDWVFEDELIEELALAKDADFSSPIAILSRAVLSLQEQVTALLRKQTEPLMKVDRP